MNNGLRFIILGDLESKSKVCTKKEMYIHIVGKYLVCTRKGLNLLCGENKF